MKVKISEQSDKHVVVRCRTETDWKDFLQRFNLQATPQYEEPINPFNVDWTAMPDYRVIDEKWPLLHLYYETPQHRTDLETFCNAKIVNNSLWYPSRPELMTKKVWKTDSPVNTKYPIYIISKGRWNKRWTQKQLELFNIPYKIVVEACESDRYQEHVSADKLLVLPVEMDNLGEGSIPVRNYVWKHSMDLGYSRHWILDDNIDGFFRFHKNQRVRMETGIFFNIIENYADRYENLPLVGLQYTMFVPMISKRRPVVQKNTRVYSCMLIQNKIPGLDEKWRGTYNEDTDLSLRILKLGYPTLLFNCFLCNKKPTLSCKGGNTCSIYTDNGLQKKVDSLVEQHPEHVKQTNKKHIDGRPHHVVNYSPFTHNEMKLKADWELIYPPEMFLV